MSTEHSDTQDIHPNLKVKMSLLLRNQSSTHDMTVLLNHSDEGNFFYFQICQTTNNQPYIYNTFTKYLFLDYDDFLVLRYETFLGRGHYEYSPGA